MTSSSPVSGTSTESSCGRPGNDSLVDNPSKRRRLEPGASQAVSDTRAGPEQNLQAEHLREMLVDKISSTTKATSDGPEQLDGKGKTRATIESANLNDWIQQATELLRCYPDPPPRELTSLVPAGVDTARQRIRELEVELIARNNRIAELQNEINKRASVTPSPFSETEQPEQLAPQAPQVRRARPCSRSQPGPSVVAMAQLLLRWLGPANGGLADIYDQIFREWLLINPVARQVAASRDRNVRNVKIGWRTREFAVMLSEEWDGTLRLSEEANWVMDAIISGMKRYVPDEFHPTNRTFHTRLRRLRECHTIVFESRDGLQTVANLLSEFFKFEGDNGGIMGERGRRILNSVCKGAPEECDILHGVQTVIFTENVLLDLLSLWKRKDTDEEYDDKAAMLSYYLSPTGACFQRPSLVSDEDEEMTAIIKQLSMLWPLESIVQHNVTQLFEPLVHPRQRLFLSRPWGPPDGPPETLYLRRVDGVQDVDIDLMSINGPLEFKAVTALGDVVDNTGCVFRSPRPFVMFDIQYTPYIRETGASCAFCGNR